MSKCDKCKYEYSHKLDEPCKYCRNRMGEVSLAYQLYSDKFQPKEEQSTVEHDGCMGCVYEDFEELEEPCVTCKGTYKHDTMAYLKAKDCYVCKDESSNCAISCKEGNKDFADEDYGLKKNSNDEIDMVNHPPHYVGHGIEPIVFIESHDLNFNLGNVIKYVSRAKYKGTELQDLKKAKCYLEREIKKYEKE